MKEKIKHASPSQAEPAGMGCQVSDEYRALQGMFLSLVYELNEQTDFPRKGLVSTMSKVAEQLQSDGKSGAAQLLCETQFALSVQLGD